MGRDLGFTTDDLVAIKDLAEFREGLESTYALTRVRFQSGDAMK